MLGQSHWVADLCRFWPRRAATRAGARPDIVWVAQSHLASAIVPNVDTLRHMARAASSNSRLTAKGRATRARIIDAAARLMYENGAANTSFEDFRKAAKASGSQMSHYFADKRSLIRAVIAHQADAVMAASIAALRVWAQRSRAPSGLRRRL